jgi:hypothetical protein
MMKVENVEKMAKAIGMLDALSYVIKNPMCDAMASAIYMLETVLGDEKSEVNGDADN